MYVVYSFMVRVRKNTDSGYIYGINGSQISLTPI